MIEYKINRNPVHWYVFEDCDEVKQSHVDYLSLGGQFWEETKERDRGCRVNSFWNVNDKGLYPPSFSSEQHLVNCAIESGVDSLTEYIEIWRSYNIKQATPKQIERAKDWLKRSKFKDYVLKRMTRIRGTKPIPAQKEWPDISKGADTIKRRCQERLSYYVLNLNLHNFSPTDWYKSKWKFGL